MKRINYPRREWWLDDQRTHRPRQKRIVSMLEINLAKQHGFEADTNKFDIKSYDIPSIIHGLGSKLSDWMRVIDRQYDASQYFEGQVLLIAVPNWFEYSVRMVEFHKDTASVVQYGEVYVLKSDYDWMRVSDEQCDICDLL